MVITCRYHNSSNKSPLQFCLMIASTCINRSVFVGFVPRPLPSFLMLHAEKWEGLVREVTCVTSWQVTPYREGWRLLCEATRFELQIWKEGLLVHVHYLLVKWSYYNRFRALHVPVTCYEWEHSQNCWPFGLPTRIRPVYTLSTLCLRMMLCIWFCIPGPPAFQHATLKCWERAWDEASGR